MELDRTNSLVIAEKYQLIEAEAFNAFVAGITGNKNVILSWLKDAKIESDGTSCTLYPVVVSIQSTVIALATIMSQETPITFTIPDTSNNYRLYVKYSQKYDGSHTNPELLVTIQSYDDNPDYLLLGVYDPSTQQWKPEPALFNNPSSNDILYALRDLSNVNDSIILSKLKVVDGSGSGLDADLLDGHDSSEFVMFDRLSFTTKTTGWYRFAESFSNCGNNGALYRIYYKRSGNHGTMLVWFGLHYGQTPTIHILSHSHYGTIDYGVTQLRIVYKGTYDKSYLELYLNTDDNTTDTTTIEIERLDNASNGWFLLNQIQNGSVPDGYTTFVVDSRYKFNMDNNLLITYNNNPVIKWFQDTDYASLEMKSYGTDKSWLTLTFGDNPNQDKIVFHWKGTDGEYDVGYLYNNKLYMKKDIQTEANIHANGTIQSETWLIGKALGNGSYIRIGGDSVNDDYEIKLDAAKPLTVWSPSGAITLNVAGHLTESEKRVVTVSNSTDSATNVKVTGDDTYFKQNSTTVKFSDNTLYITFNGVTYRVPASTSNTFCHSNCHSNCHSDCHSDCGGICH